MHIFRKKDVSQKELYLTPDVPKEKYDFFAALAKALLMFMLIFGSLGSFLSAFEVEYNSSLCMIGIFLMSLALSAVYEAKNRTFSNLMSLAFFGIFFYVGIRMYWTVNSGYYAIMNKMFEAARDYLHITRGTEYTLIVDRPYMTVTLFVLFLGLGAVILLNMHFQNRVGWIRVVAVTFLPQCIPLYLERKPSSVYVILLLAAYVTLFVLRGYSDKNRMTKQMRYALGLSLLLAIVVVQGTSALIPREKYRAYVHESAAKTASRESAEKLAQLGFMAMFRHSGNGAGMSGGALSKGAATIPDYETDLIVRFTPYSYYSVYLKGFTGRDYTGDSWTEVKEGGEEGSLLQNMAQIRKNIYEQNSDLQGRGVMEVENVGAARKYEYRPYYTDKAATKKAGIVSTYTYYPPVMVIPMSRKPVDEAYLYVPDSCKRAVREVCAKAEFHGTDEEIAAQILSYFDENYTYTLRPGWYFGNPDYISHFLLESKKGYCAHFASAATMLFRAQGIPARYVEGYAFSYRDVIEDATLVEDARYGDYYDGYSKLGETALVELEIPDAYAHAWVEIYTMEHGWIAVDPTPAQADEETASFWDAFSALQGGGENLNLGYGGGEYLERALVGITYVIMAAAAVMALVFLVLAGRKRRRLRAMSEADRVKNDYGELQKLLHKKYPDTRTCRTVREELDAIRYNCGRELPDGLEENLYGVFFAGKTDCDWDVLKKQLQELRGQLRKARRK